jgi:hypothetical protein
VKKEEWVIRFRVRL